MNPTDHGLRFITCQPGVSAKQTKHVTRASYHSEHFFRLPDFAVQLAPSGQRLTPAGLWIASDNLDGANACAKQSGHAGICFLPYPA